MGTCPSGYWGLTLFNVKTEISDIPRPSAHWPLRKRSTEPPALGGQRCASLFGDALGDGRTLGAGLSAPWRGPAGEGCTVSAPCGSAPWPAGPCCGVHSVTALSLPSAPSLRPQESLGPNRNVKGPEKGLQGDEYVFCPVKALFKM